MRGTIALLLLLFTVMVADNQVGAANITWVGPPASYNEWNTAANWDGGKVPTKDDNVFIKFAAMTTLFVSSGQSAAAKSITMANTYLAIFVPFVVGDVVGADSEVVVFPHNPSSFGSVNVYTFDLALSQGSSARVQKLTAAYLFLYPKSNLTLGSDSTVSGTFYLTNGRIIGEVSLRSGSVFVDADNVTSLAVPAKLKANKKVYANAQALRSALHQRKIRDEQVRAMHAASVEVSDAGLVAAAAAGVVPAVISQVDVYTSRFTVLGSSYESSLVFEQGGSIHASA